MSARRAPWIVIACGTALFAVGLLWALAGRTGDANIGAGLIGLAGGAGLVIGVVWLAGRSLAWAFKRTP